MLQDESSSEESGELLDRYEVKKSSEKMIEAQTKKSKRRQKQEDAAKRFTKHTKSSQRQMRKSTMDVLSIASPSGTLANSLLPVTTTSSSQHRNSSQNSDESDSEVDTNEDAFDITDMTFDSLLENPDLTIDDILNGSSPLPSTKHQKKAENAISEKKKNLKQKQGWSKRSSKLFHTS